MARKRERPDVPVAMLEHLRAIFARLPRCHEEDAWVGVRWRPDGSTATIAHIFGGEDQRFRIVFRAEPDEVIAFENLGEPYFRGEWGGNLVGMLLDDDTDWEEIAELLTDSFCLQAPKALAALVDRPDRGE
ncbi:MmcQ/YjbR family DNA-binding protein [Nocardioides sp. AE5]|uniref:MmcQ/YjbR family DNA-binding protein n=1 Tax=Nocardioides sp. AE5 TaxID=2962573 RepID=UPI0028821820|nr:MmcQ/YjbR family DNA-binding protein [Nocardioides sp. AE5]MDT0200925.1 MmcQ/YjbR family DNA-binding protein [Nocardioides sp. AE5]